MSGHVLPLQGPGGPWAGGDVTASARCVLAPNPSPWTLDGTNTWLLGRPGSSAVVIVDPGPDHPGHLATVRAAAEERGGVALILLTHGHHDHAEGAGRLAREVGAPVRAWDPQHRLGDEGLAGGDVIDLGDWRIDVVGTPGHTRDSVCLVLSHDGSLLTGDTVLGRGTSLVAWPDGHLGDYLASLRRLRERLDLGADGVGRIDRLLPGHGPVLPDPMGAIDAYLDHRLARLAEVADVVAGGVTEPSAIVATVYADVPRAVWPAAEMNVRAQLEYLGHPQPRSHHR
ncbi:MAG: MBL fold metallo-hydrolase [Candidatus Nanopelagicales bacterium]